MKKAIIITAAVLIALLGVLVGVGQALDKEGGPQQGSEAVKEAPLDQGGTTQQAGVAVKEAPPPSGGAQEKARVTDSVEYTIRDAKGNIKDHKVIGR